MKLMDLKSAHRRWLNLNAALDFDKDLNEKLVGLTHNESIFFVEMIKDTFGNLELRNVDELERFIELHERHERTLAFQRVKQIDPYRT